MQKLEFLFSKGKNLSYKKGEIILRGGDLPQGVMYLKKGYVKIEFISKEGKELTMVIYRPGELFPIVWTFFGEGASIYDFEALTDCEIQRVPREDVSDFIRLHPDVLVYITRQIIIRFQDALRRMTFLTFGNASSKLASVLLNLAYRFSIQKKEGLELQIPLTHKDIANLVGVTRETVSIELKRFAKKGYIAYRKKFITLNNKEILHSKAIL